jgi:hypothetical protein
VIKRFGLVAFIIFISIIVSGCQQLTDAPPKQKKPGKNEVVETHGSLENFQRLDQFIQNVQNQKKDKLRLTRYTIEGDPIYHDLDYDGTSLTYTYDTTQDKYGEGKVTISNCQGIEKQESETETKYMLLGCPEPYMEDLITISHDVDQEDYFAFELKYGVGMKNVINTKEQKLTKDLQNGETVAVSDFQFSKSELNQIYKLMVFANYLEKKDLTTKCNQKPYEAYELSVWINGSDRHFEWSECDKSNDGEEMTKLVDDIIAVLKNNPTYQALPDVKGNNE